jgi:hypothetical protein
MENNDLFKIPTPEIVEAFCSVNEKENLLDASWLFGAVPWANHDNKIACFKFVDLEKDNFPPISIEMFAIELNGYDTQKPKLKKFSFDSIIISAFHGFGGNNYGFNFMLNGESVHNTDDERSFAYSEEDVKKRYIEKLELRLKGLEYQINYEKLAIEKISKLNLDDSI